MEKRLILAIFLSFLILFLYQLLFIKPHTPPQKPAEPVATTQESRPPIGGSVQAKVAGPVNLEEQKVVKSGLVAAEKEEEVIVETPLYIAIWDNRGGVLKSWKLKH